MALRTPPSWLQNGSHPAENDRLTSQAIFATTGIVGSASLAVTQNSPAAMNVLVASGWCAIVGTTQSNMGVYQAFNDATATVTIGAADPSNPRIDIVCVTISDAYYSGTTNTVAFNVVAGTPAGSPSAPSTPANSLKLAEVYVGAGVTSITTANITDSRVEVTTNLPVGDITAVTAGSNLTGGGTSGSVTLALDALVSAQEKVTVSATAATGTINFDAVTQSVLYYTSNASANFTLNFRGSSGTTLSSLLDVGDSITLVLLNTNGSTAYYPTTFQIDGSAVTPKWQGGTAPTAGNASSLDIYSFTIIKTAATPTYVVLASQVKFA